MRVKDQERGVCRKRWEGGNVLSESTAKTNDGNFYGTFERSSGREVREVDG